MTFAGCVLDQRTFEAWERHWAPPVQPFFVSDPLAQRLPTWPRFTRQEFARSGVPLSLHDTFTTYSVAQNLPWALWLNNEAFATLGRAEQRELLNEQHTSGRGGVVGVAEIADLLEPTTLGKLAERATDGWFVWWPELWGLLGRSERERVLGAFVEHDRLSCRRLELRPEEWRRVAEALPGARDLAGSFLPESGGNCLATVMAAFGAPAIADRWVHPEPFERWLGRFTPLPERAALDAGHLNDLGTVLVWRGDGGCVQHAAVCLGEGFVLHKEAQSWYAPRQVVGLEDALARWREDGQLSAYRVTTEA